jgi:transketolase C-terminal domain/subunit
MSSAEVLVELAEQDPNVVLVSQDFGPIGGFTGRFPDRHFDLGISERITRSASSTCFFA